jgi:hypothetical protein
MRARFYLMIFGLAATPVGGCTTYQDTKTKLETGYYEDLKLEAERETERAKDEQVSIQRDLQAVQDEKLAVDRDIATVEQQLADIGAELSAASQSLERARRDNEVSRQQYEGLKEELDRLTLERQTQSFAADSAEKRRRIAELKSKKEAFEKMLQALATN